MVTPTNSFKSKKMRVVCLLAIMQALSMVLCLFTAVVETLAAPPNVLFILADDLGVGDVSVYPSPLQDRLRTPVLEKMAAEGMVFTAAYAGYSVCAPSRRTLMTGYHSGHFDSGANVLLGNASKTVASILGRSGYVTKLIGKWGLDGNYRTPQPPTAGFPTLQGFDGFYGQSDQWQCHNYYPSFMFNGTTNFTVEQNIGASPKSCGPDRGKCVWSGDLWTTNAIQFIHEQKQTVGASARPQPWFLYLAYTAPHAGSVGTVNENDVPAPRVAENPYASQKSVWPDVEVDFATAVTEVDTAVGEVIAAVDNAGMKESTIIFFSSDNGAHNEGGHNYMFFNSSAYLNGFKRSIHDGGHRAPFIVRWPGVVPAGTVTAHQVAFYDFLPTVAELAGVSSDAPPAIDGHSFAPTLRGDTQAQPPFIYHEYAGCDDPVFRDASFPHAFGQNIRMGEWSGVCVTASAACQPVNASMRHKASTPTQTFFLYNMTSDPGQLRNLAEQHPDVVDAILEIMRTERNVHYDPPTH